jgi:hypothetical protein
MDKKTNNTQYSPLWFLYCGEAFMDTPIKSTINPVNGKTTHYFRNPYLPDEKSMIIKRDENQTSYIKSHIIDNEWELLQIEI